MTPLAPGAATSPFTPATDRPPTVVAPAEGRPLRAFGSEILFKLGAERTGGALSLGLATVPVASGGPPPHAHEGEDEILLVLEGRYRVWVEGVWSEAGPGSVVFLPRGLAHTFHVVGGAPGRHWVLTTSSAFERFFAGCAELFAEPGPPDRERLAAVAAAHGMTFRRPG